MISSFFAWTDPAAAIAADTPQIDTAEDITARSVLGSWALPPSHHVKKKTEVTMISAWIMPPVPLVTRSPKLIFAPSSTTPIFKYSSVRTAGRTNVYAPVSLSMALAVRPISAAVSGYSNGFCDTSWSRKKLAIPRSNSATSSVSATSITSPTTKPGSWRRTVGAAWI